MPEHKPKNTFFRRPNKLVMWVDVEPSNKIYKLIIINISDSRTITFKGNKEAYTEWNMETKLDISSEPFSVIKGKLFKMGLPTKAFDHAWDKYDYPNYKGLDETKKYDAEIHISRPNTKIVKIHYLKIFENKEVKILE